MIHSQFIQFTGLYKVNSAIITAFQEDSTSACFAGATFSSFISSTGLSLHHVASDDPVMFMSGPNTAGANPMVATLPISNAMPEASPEFCIPTSKAIVLQDFLSTPSHRQLQYPKR